MASNNKDQIDPTIIIEFIERGNEIWRKIQPNASTNYQNDGIFLFEAKKWCSEIEKYLDKEKSPDFKLDNFQPPTVMNMRSLIFPSKERLQQSKEFQTELRESVLEKISKLKDINQSLLKSTNLYLNTKKRKLWKDPENIYFYESQHKSSKLFGLINYLCRNRDYQTTPKIMKVAGYKKDGTFYTAKNKLNKLLRKKLDLKINFIDGNKRGHGFRLHPSLTVEITN